MEVIKQRLKTELEDHWITRPSIPLFFVPIPSRPSEGLESGSQSRPVLQII